MPKITSYTPAWLCKPNPGHEIFISSTKDTSFPSISKATNGKKNAEPGPLRTIARRGTEVFVAVGKEIRWADLVYMKEAWEYEQEKKRGSRKGMSSPSQYEGDHAQGYRVYAQRLSPSL